MENLKDKILEEYGLKFEDLNIEERETYNSSYFDIKSITLQDLKQHITDMKNAVALQLCDVASDIDKDRSLKARLKNYILLEAFLTAPEKAEQALRSGLEGAKKSIRK